MDNNATAVQINEEVRCIVSRDTGYNGLFIGRAQWRKEALCNPLGKYLYLASSLCKSIRDIPCSLNIYIYIYSSILQRYLLVVRIRKDLQIIKEKNKMKERDYSRRELSGIEVETQASVDNVFSGSRYFPKPRFISRFMNWRNNGANICELLTFTSYDRVPL